jgi:hypothetical protein
VLDRPQTSPTAVELEYAGGKIECTRATRNTGGGAPDREATLSLEVRMDVTSQDGVLAETMTGSVSRGVSTRLAFGGSIPAGDKKGTLELVPMPGYVISLAISGSIGRTAPDALEGDVGQRGTQGNMGQVRSLGTLQ